MRAQNRPCRGGSQDRTMWCHTGATTCQEPRFLDLLQPPCIPISLSLCTAQQAAYLRNSDKSLFLRCHPVGLRSLLPAGVPQTSFLITFRQKSRLKPVFF